MKEFLQQYQSLIEDIEDEISLLANTGAFLFHRLTDVSWAGFYLQKNNELVLGPFQGNVACTNIAMGNGVCGVSAQTKAVVRVENVHEFKGHIACDHRSNSEIVVPMIIHHQLYGVLDIDSTSLSRFTNQDQILLETLVSLLIKQMEGIIYES